MRRSVKPSDIGGCVRAPSSKSIVQRALAVALLAGGNSKLLGVTPADDVWAAVRVSKALGATVSMDEKNRELHVAGHLAAVGEVLDCGESALSLRMFTCLAACCHQELTLTGCGTLLSRPVDMMEEPLSRLGVRVKTNGGYPPLTVHGPMKGGTIHLDGGITSQFLTGLLITLPAVTPDSLVLVKNLQSTPYIDMTLQLLADSSVCIERTGYHRFSIKGGQTYRLDTYRVEGDWSNAAFLLAAGASAGSVRVSGLNPCSLQADRRFIDALNAAGARVKVSADGVEVTRQELTAFTFDARQCPDLFPPLVALACSCQGTSRLRGVGRLRYKESDRGAVLVKEFSALGAGISIDGDWMSVSGTGTSMGTGTRSTLRGGTLHAHGDHRIAMAGAVAALNADDEIIIEGSECVSKSYPGFFEVLVQLGGNIDE